MEAELTVSDIAGAEAEWLYELLMDLPVVEKLVPAISINYDNQTVITKQLIYETIWKFESISYVP
jgi:hypothetical protein